MTKLRMAFQGPALASLVVLGIGVLTPSGCDDGVHRPNAQNTDTTTTSDTSAADGSAQPDTASQPDATATPDGTSAPDAAPTPDGSSTPDAPAPDVTSTPDGTVEDIATTPDAVVDAVEDTSTTPDVPVTQDTGPPPAGTLTAAHCGTATPAYAAGTGIAVSGGGTEGRVAHTLDGETWIDEVTTSMGPVDPGHTRNLIRGVGYGGGVWVAVGGYDNGYISVTCDGQTWRHDVLGTNTADYELGQIPDPYSDFLSDVAYHDGVFVAAGGAGARLTSEDHGLTWTSTGEYYGGHLRSIATGNALFVAVGHDWNGNDFGSSTTSTDGTTWTPMLETPGGAFGRVAFGGGRFVATGQSHCAWTTDGAAWTDCAHGVTGADQGSLMYMNGQFYLQFLDGNWLTSADGENWSAPQSGWLPDNVTDAGDRFIFTRWEARGYGLTFGDWQTFTYPNIGQVEWGVITLGAP